MPPTLPVPFALRVGLTWTVATAVFGSRFFFGYTGNAPTTVDCTAFALAVRNSYATNMTALAGVGTNLTKVKVQDLSSATPGIGYNTTAADGSRAGFGLPLSTPATLGFAIDLVYRGGKPKIFLPFGTTDDSGTEQDWTPGFITDVESGWDAFVTALNGISSGSTTLTDHISIQYYKGYNKALPPWRGPGFKYPPLALNPPVPYAVSFNTLKPTYGAQRRRTSVG